MSLPDLSRGRLGTIDFGDMNRVFRATERVEAMQSPQRGEVEGARFPILVRLTVNEGGTGWVGYDTWRWEAVRAFKSGIAFDIESYGVTSAQWSPQAIAVAPIGLAPGSLAHLWPLPANFGHTGDGIRRTLLAVPIVAATSTVASGVIIAVTNTGDSQTKGYAGYIVARHQNIDIDLFSVSGLAIPCINSFELSGALQNQVQTESPGTKTLLRLPVGTLVGPISQMPSATGELWIFTQPNAYGVIC